MKRKDVWEVNFTPSLCVKIERRRLVLIVSNDISNKYLGRLQVVPLDADVAEVYPSEALVTINNVQNKAMVHQITTMNKSSFFNKTGNISDSDMLEVDNALKLQIGLR